MTDRGDSGKFNDDVAGCSEAYFNQAEKLIAHLRDERDQLRLDYAIELAHSAGLMAQIKALREDRELAEAS